MQLPAMLDDAAADPGMDTKRATCETLSRAVRFMY